MADKHMRMIMLGLAFAGGAIVTAGAWAVSSPPDANFGTVTAQRVNIVEPNGKFRLVLANSARFPGLFSGGKEYKHHSRKGGGMLFFNDDGDEVGGMSFNSENADGHQSASASMMFDQFHQDQTVGLVYSESDRHRAAGLRVWDRPDSPIQPLMEMSDRAARAPTDADKQRIRAEMLAYANAHGGVGSERCFAGKQSEDAVVRLADKSGKPRLVMRVGADGMPSIEFLDEAGKVVKRITP